METLTRPAGHAPTNPPAVAVSSVMGICGLGLSWRAAGQVLAAPRAIGEWLIASVYCSLSPSPPCTAPKHAIRAL
jgi:hypothetical protein